MSHDENKDEEGDQMSGVQDAQFARLERAANLLNQKTEDLMEVIQRTEERLLGLRVGAACWLEDKHDWLAYNVEHGGWQLGFSKDSQGQRWHLMARRVTMIGPPYPAILLADAPRLVRLEACAKFEKLFDRLAAKAEQFAEDLEQAIKKVT